MKIEVTSQRTEMLLFLTTRSIRVHFSLYLKTKALVCSQAFIKMTCVRQQNSVNV